MPQHDTPTRADNATTAQQARTLADERLPNDTAPRTDSESITRYVVAYNAGTHLNMMVQRYYKGTKR